MSTFKETARLRRKQRIRKQIIGSGERPRLAVFRSLKHIYAQVIDDVTGETLAHASSLEKGFSSGGGNVAVAKQVGHLVAEKALKKGISKVVFDRGGNLYHGRVKALADAAREKGLQF